MVGGGKRRICGENIYAMMPVATGQLIGRIIKYVDYWTPDEPNLGDRSDIRSSFVTDAFQCFYDSQYFEANGTDSVRVRVQIIWGMDQVKW